jgi:hypothetical protein
VTVNLDGFNIELPPELIEAVAARAAELVRVHDREAWRRLLRMAGTAGS